MFNISDSSDFSPSNDIRKKFTRLKLKKKIIFPPNECFLWVYEMSWLENDYQQRYLSSKNKS